MHAWAPLAGADTMTPSTGDVAEATRVPRISVIVTAYRRQEFLPYALDSLRAQTLPADAFEVFVATDMEPGQLSTHITGLNVTWLGTPTGIKGKDLAQAIRLSRGDVLVVLDDDDLVAPQRMEAIDQTFRADPDVVYFHNNFAIIDDRAVVMENHPFRAREREARARIGRVQRQGPDPWAALRHYPPLAPDFNSSSLAIRKRTVEGRLDTLETIPLTVEAFFFTAAALAARSIVLDPRVLTFYRIHSANYSIAGSTADPLARVQRFSELALPGYEAVARMARESGNPAAVRETEESVRVHRMYAALRSSGGSRRRMWTAWKQARKLRDSYTWATENARGVLNVAAIVYLASPRLAQWLYVRRMVSRMAPAQS